MTTPQDNATPGFTPPPVPSDRAAPETRNIAATLLKNP